MDRVFLCFVLLVCFLSHIPAEETVSIATVLSTVEKIVGYYRSNYQHMNLDGIFGLRALEGQLELILEQVRHDQSVGMKVGSHLRDWDQVLLRLSHLHTDAHAIGNSALISLKASEPHYYKKLHALVEKPFKFAKEYKRVNPLLVWSSTSTAELSEETCDACMSEILETGGDGCSLSTSCLSTLLKQRLTAYGLTHQILYTIVAEMYGCDSVVNAYLREQGIANSVQHFQQMLCSNNFHQVVRLLVQAQGRIVPSMQDLFMEEQFVCPMLGYMEFLHNHWLHLIVSWQSSLGCYGLMSAAPLNNRPQKTDTYRDAQKPRPVNSEAAVQQSQDKLVMFDTNNKAYSMNATKVKADFTGGGRIAANRPLLAGHKTRPKLPEKLINEVIVEPPNEPFKPLKGPRRRLLMERSLDDGCLAHKTATALGALSQYLRFLVFPGPLTYKITVNLQSVNHLMHSALSANTSVQSKPKSPVRQNLDTVDTEKVKQKFEVRQEKEKLVVAKTEGQPEKIPERVEEIKRPEQRVVGQSEEDPGQDYYNNGEIELQAVGGEEGGYEVKTDTGWQKSDQNQRWAEQNQRRDDQNLKWEDWNQRLEGQNKILDAQKQMLEVQNQRWDDKNQRLDEHNQRLDGLNQRLEGQNQRLDGQNQKWDDKKIEPIGQKSRQEEVNQQRWEPNLNPVAQNPRPGEQNLNPVEQNLNPVEQNLNPVEQNVRPADNYLRLGEQRSNQDGPGPTKYINDPWPADNNPVIEGRRKMDQLLQLQDGYYEDQREQPYLEVDADLSSEVSLVKGEWDGDEGSGLTRGYLVVMAATALVLYVMWLFIRNRRVLIRYRHR